MATGFRTLLLAATLSIAATTGTAIAGEEDKGFYIKAGYGGNNIDSVDNCDHSSTPCTVGTYYLKDSNNSWDIGLGYDWGSFRSEFSYERTNQDLKSYAGTDNVEYTASKDTDLEIDSYDLGLYYDFDKLDLGKFTPYVGFVYGFTDVNVGDHNANASDVPGGSSSTNKIEYKLGLDYEIANNVDIYGEGSYIIINDIRVKDNDYTDIEGYGAKFGLRYRF